MYNPVSHSNKNTSKQHGQRPYLSSDERRLSPFFLNGQGVVQHGQRKDNMDEKRTQAKDDARNSLDKENGMHVI